MKRKFTILILAITATGLYAAPVFAQQETYTYRSAKLDSFYTTNRPNPYRGGHKVVMTITVPTPLPPNTKNISIGGLNGTFTYSDGVHTYSGTTNTPLVTNSNVRTGEGGRIIESQMDIFDQSANITWDYQSFPNCFERKIGYGLPGTVACDVLTATNTPSDQAAATTPGNWHVTPPLTSPSPAPIANGLR